ncbi:MAG: helix-turn-helix domain-containing protein [Patulibacter sp.]|nr:helix-turn-helix domain-containing protein [Patulibacter sp.]
MADLKIEFSDDALDDLAEAIAERVARLVILSPGADPDRWMTSAEAAEYLGTTVNALHKHTGARDISFSQEAPGGKLWFKRRDLDAWREGHR